MNYHLIFIVIYVSITVMHIETILVKIALIILQSKVGKVMKMNCPSCGRFMQKESFDDSPLEDEVIQWWSCKEHGMYPEHLYFKSSNIHKERFIIV